MLSSSVVLFAILTTCFALPAVIVPGPIVVGGGASAVVSVPPIPVVPLPLSPPVVSPVVSIVNGLPVPGAIVPPPIPSLALPPIDSIVSAATASLASVVDSIDSPLASLATGGAPSIAIPRPAVGDVFGGLITPATTVPVPADVSDALSVVPALLSQATQANNLLTNLLSLLNGLGLSFTGTTTLNSLTAQIDSLSQALLSATANSGPIGGLTSSSPLLGTQAVPLARQLETLATGATRVVKTKKISPKTLSTFTNSLKTLQSDAWAYFTTIGPHCGTEQGAVDTAWAAANKALTSVSQAL
ncbi:hypothetical protein C8F01DRAFT_1148504 [Mycena amicta]|nr:hypothetical protein C8F01DRAFT_1148504 [Mycena amicta]